MITLTKDKIIHTNQWGSQSDKYVRKEVTALYPYLEDVVELSDDFTLGDLFLILEREIGLMEIIFSSALGHWPLQLYIDDMKKFAEDEGDKLEYLQIQRFGERWEHSGEIDLSIDFSGISLVEDINYAIEFSPLYTLKDLPLRLNKEFTISDMRCPSKVVWFFMHIRNRICKPSFGWLNRFSYTYVKGTTCFSVRELISAVLSEISFAGAPFMRDETIAETVRRCQEIKQEIADDE